MFGIETIIAIVGAAGAVIWGFLFKRNTRKAARREAQVAVQQEVTRVEEDKIAKADAARMKARSTAAKGKANVSDGKASPAKKGKYQRD